MSDLDDEFEQAQDIEEDWDDDDVLDGYENSSFVCEDCDYRWDEMTEEEVDESSMVCPMCGSVNVTLI